MRIGAFSSVNRCGPVLGLGRCIPGAFGGIGDLGCFGLDDPKL